MYAGLDPLLERPVALKALHPKLPEALREVVLHRFQVELKVFGRIHHPHIVNVFDASLADDLPFLVLELCSGPSMDGLLSRSGRLEPGRAASIFYQAALGLDHIHSLGIVHRDIKPANFLFHDRALKLTDFGVSQASFLQMPEDGQVVGTPAYMSPEQFVGEGVTHRSDLFALAVVLFEMLTGTLPFVGDSTSVLYQRVYDRIPQASSVAPDLPPDIDEFFSRALARDPARRFASGAELCEALSQVIPEADLTPIEGAYAASSAATAMAYRYGSAPRSAPLYVASRARREPPPPTIPASARVGGAVPPPWHQSSPVAPEEMADILTFDGLVNAASGIAGRPGPGSIAAGELLEDDARGSGGLEAARPPFPPSSERLAGGAGGHRASAWVRLGSGVSTGAPLEVSRYSLWGASVATGMVMAFGIWFAGERGLPGAAGVKLEPARAATRALLPATGVPAGTGQAGIGAPAMGNAATNGATAGALPGASALGGPLVLELQLGPETVHPLEVTLSGAGVVWHASGAERLGGGRYRVAMQPAREPDTEPARAAAPSIGESGPAGGVNMPSSSLVPPASRISQTVF